MNEFERRMLDIAQREVDLNSVLASMGRSVLAEHFGYTLQFGSEDVPLVANVQQTKMINMQSDAWFVLHYISSAIVSDANDFWMTDASSIQLQITNSGSGYVLYSNPSSAAVLSSVTNRGSTGLPFLLPVPVILPPNSNVKIDVTQFANVAQQYNGCWISLMGTRVAMI